MRRKPEELVVDKYLNSLHIRRFKPILSWHKCDKCNMEYTREYMYECSEPSIVGFTWRYYTRGCSHCFNSENDFKKYLEEKGKILTRDNFYDNPINLLH